MPSIPLPYDSTGGLNANFQSAPNPGPGVRVSTGEEVNALGELKQATQTVPTVKPRSYSGMEELGKGIEGIGALWDDIGKRNQKVTDIRKLSDVTTSLTVAGQDLKTQLNQEKDPSKWEDIAQDYTDKHIGTLDYDGMSQFAKQHAMDSADHWQALQLSQARNGAVVQNEALAYNSLKEQARAGVQTRNPQMVASAYDAMASNKMVPADKAANDMMQDVTTIGHANLQEASTIVGDKVSQGDFDGADKVIKDMPQIQGQHPLFVAGREQLQRQVDVGRKIQSLSTDMATDSKGFYSSLLDIKNPDEDEHGNYVYKPADGDKKAITLTPPELDHWRSLAYQTMQTKSNQAMGQVVNDMDPSVLKIQKRSDLEDKAKYPDLSDVDRSNALKAFDNRAVANLDPFKLYLQHSQLAADISYVGDDKTKKVQMDQVQQNAHLYLPKGPSLDRLDKEIEEYNKGDPGSVKGQVQKFLTDTFRTEAVMEPFTPGAPGGTKWLGVFGNALLGGVPGVGTFDTTTPPTLATPLDPRDAARAALPPTRPDGKPTPGYLHPGDPVRNKELSDQRMKAYLDAQNIAEAGYKNGRTAEQIIKDIQKPLQDVPVRRITPSLPGATSLLPAGSVNDTAPTGSATDLQKLLDTYAPKK